MRGAGKGVLGEGERGTLIPSMGHNTRHTAPPSPLSRHSPNPPPPPPLPLTADGHARGGRRLRHDDLAPALESAQHVPPLLPLEKRTRGAHRGALPALDAVGVGQRDTRRDADPSVLAPPHPVQHVHALHLVAHVHAPAALDAVVELQLKALAAVVHVRAQLQAGKKGVGWRVRGEGV